MHYQHCDVQLFYIKKKPKIRKLVNKLSLLLQLSLVTLALLETLVDSNCEDVLLTLVFKPLIPCSHVMLSQRSRLTHLDPFAKSATKFLSLIPRIGNNKLVTFCKSFFFNYFWPNVYIKDKITLTECFVILLLLKYMFFFNFVNYNR